jgi:hypothetical protein
MTAPLVLDIVTKLTADKSLDFVNDTIKLRLSTALLTTNTDVTTMAGITEFVEHDGDNYPVGGATLAGKTSTLDDANHRTSLDASDIVFTALGAATATCKCGVVVKSVDGGVNDIPLVIFTWAAPVTNDGTDWSVHWNAAGIYCIGAPAA